MKNKRAFSLQERRKCLESSANIGQRCLWVSGTSKECDLCSSLCLCLLQQDSWGVPQGFAQPCLVSPSPWTQKRVGAAHLLAQTQDECLVLGPLKQMLNPSAPPAVTLLGQFDQFTRWESVLANTYKGEIKPALCMNSHPLSIILMTCQQNLQ